LTAGIYWPRANRLGAVAGILGGLGSWLLLLVVQDAWPADLMAMVVNAILLATVSLATAGRDVPLPLKTLEGEPLAARRRLGVLPPFGRAGAPSPGP